MLVNQLILVAMATVTLVAASTMKACNFTGTPDLVAEAEWHPARDEMANWKKLGCAKNMWGGTFGWNYKTWCDEETGKLVQVCWRNEGPYTLTWTGADARAAKCNLDYYFTRPDEICTSYKSVKCDGGYQGRFQQIMSPDGEYLKTPEYRQAKVQKKMALEIGDAKADSIALKNAIDAFVGVQVSYREDCGPVFYIVDTPDGSLTNPTRSTLNRVEIRFDGERKCGEFKHPVRVRK